MSDDLTVRLHAFLAAHSTLSLATVDAHGQPMAAGLFYIADEALNLYWVSGASSRHSRNLASQARAAVVVYAQTWSWLEIQGVQMEGAVTVLPHGDLWEQTWELYLAKFPFASEFQAEVSRSAFYKFKPDWARWLDNQQGFGHKEEIRLAF